MRKGVIVLIAACLMWLVSFSPARALTCSNGKPPSAEIDCVIGGSRCAVCEHPSTTWNRPTLEVVYQVFKIGEEHRGVMAMGECSDIHGIRFCARTANPGTVKDPQTGVIPPNYGNNTGSTPNPRPQLCAYEDMVDGMDLDRGRSPYHHMAKNGSAPSMVQGMVMGGIAGHIIGPPGFGLITAAVGALVTAIMSHYNHIVPLDLGCVERPIAVGPPAWCNNCWKRTYIPGPIITHSEDSTFFKPYVDLLFCEEIDFKGNPKGRPMRCQYKSDGITLINGMRLAEAVTVPLTANGTAQRISASVAVNHNYTKPDGTVMDVDKRHFEARVDAYDPKNICVYRTQESDGSPTEILEGCVLRPGYMPLPIVGVSADSTSTTPKLSVTLQGDPAATRLDSLGAGPCKRLHQITFCAKRRCLDGGPAGGDYAAAMGTCTNLADNLCLSGYSTAPLVVASPPTVAAYGAAVPGLPNTMKPANVAFMNTQAIPEKIGGTITPISLKLKLNAWVYERFGCLRINNLGQCLEYQDATIPVGANDPYWMNTATQVIRPMEPEELGMCATNPADATPYTFNTPGNHTFTIPKNCAEITVKVWGAGGGGVVDHKRTGWFCDGYDEESGGAGGGFAKGIFAVDEVNLKENQTYNLTVGRGGQGCESTQAHGDKVPQCPHVQPKGGDSSFSGIITATGGSWGGTTGCDWSSYPDNEVGTGSCNMSLASSCMIKPGLNGEMSTGTRKVLLGGAAWDGNGAYVTAPPLACDGPNFDIFDPEAMKVNTLLWTPPSEIALSDINNLIFPTQPGVGGCSEQRLNVDGYDSPPGAGGHGAVTIQCTASKQSTTIPGYP